MLLNKLQLVFCIFCIAFVAYAKNDASSKYLREKLNADLSDTMQEISQLKAEFDGYAHDLLIWSNANANATLRIKDKNGKKYRDYCAKAYYVEDLSEACKELFPKYIHMPHAKFILDFKQEYAATRKHMFEVKLKLAKIDKEELSELASLNNKYNSDRNLKIEKATAKADKLKKTIVDMQRKHQNRMCGLGHCNCDKKISNMERELTSTIAEIKSLSVVNDSAKEHIDAAKVKSKYENMRNELLAESDLAIAMNQVVDKYMTMVNSIGHVIAERMETINSKAISCNMKLKRLDLVMHSDNSAISANVYSNDLKKAYASLGLLVESDDEKHKNRLKNLVWSEDNLKKDLEHKRTLEKIGALTKFEVKTTEKLDVSYQDKSKENNAIKQKPN